MLRVDLRTRTRDYLYESVANIFTDDQLNRYFEEEVRSLPSKDVYKEEIYTTSTAANQQDYTLPSDIFKVEMVEIDYGNSTTHYWSELNGVDVYGGSLHLPFIPSGVETLRIKIKAFFTVTSDDQTTLDIPDDQTELVVWGMTIRAYKQVIGYLRDSKSWDSVTKPGELSMTSIQNFLQIAKKEYQDLLRQYATVPLPREINLVS